MEVMIPPTSRDFDFGSGRSTPCGPSTPKRFGEYYFSAPTSPSRMADLYGYIDVELSSSTTGNHHGGSRPKASGEVENEEGEEEDFAFDFYKGSDSTSLSAEELFDGGKIRPLKPPPPPPQTELAGKSPARSPRSPVRQGKRTDKEDDGGKNKQEQERGRGRAPAGSGGPRAARSLSPYRVSSYPWEEDEKEKWQQQLHPKPKSSHQQGSLPRLPPAAGSSKGDSGSTSKKWKLKDFFLFRSASEGRATDKDPFGKFAGVFKKQEEMKNSNFGWGAADSPVAGSTSRRRRRPGPVSAHELHYTVNKAVSEELKKRTFLPYKQGILGRLAFNPAVHALANGFGSLTLYEAHISSVLDKVPDEWRTCINHWKQQTHGKGKDLLNIISMKAWVAERLKIHTYHHNANTQLDKEGIYMYVLIRKCCYAEWLPS